MLRSSSKPLPSRMGPKHLQATHGNGHGNLKGLAPMKERPEIDEQDWEGADYMRGGGESEDEGRGHIREAGVIGMLHQFTKR